MCSDFYVSDHLLAFVSDARPELLFFIGKDDGRLLFVSQIIQPLVDGLLVSHWVGVMVDAGSKLVFVFLVQMLFYELFLSVYLPREVLLLFEELA